MFLVPHYTCCYCLRISYVTYFSFCLTFTRYYISILQMQLSSSVFIPRFFLRFHEDSFPHYFYFFSSTNTITLRGRWIIVVFRLSLLLIVVIRCALRCFFFWVDFDVASSHRSGFGDSGSILT